MPSFNTIKLSDLTTLFALEKNNKLVIEDEYGTAKLDLEFLNLQKSNTSFYTAFNTISANIVPLSGNIDSYVTDISSTSNIVTHNLIASISSTINAEYKKTYYRSGRIVVPAGLMTSYANYFTVSAGLTGLSATDVRVGFASAGIGTRYISMYPLLSSVSPFLYDLKVRLTSVSTSTPLTALYNIFKPY